MSSPYWHGLPPFVEFHVEPAPWLMDSIRFSLEYQLAHPRPMMPYQDPKAQYAWWDGSCLCTALVKEGPKAMVVYGK
jgi:hypothetical protein